MKWRNAWIVHEKENQMTAPVGKLFVSIWLVSNKFKFEMIFSLDDKMLADDIKKCKIAQTQIIATEFSDCKKVLFIKLNIIINSYYF